MLFPLLSEADPPATSEGSLDPLGTHAIADTLARRLVPGLRELHAQMNWAMLVCYGWDDLGREHDFYENERGRTCYTVSPTTRREIIQRLVDLNLQLASKDGWNTRAPYRAAMSGSSDRKGRAWTV